jgi:RNA polymerase sigma factor (TIGR02999 family)
MPDDASQITEFLNRAAAGDAAAAERVWSAVYDELRRIARRELRDDAAGRTLDTTGLVHEAYFKFADREDMNWDSRRQFYATACRAMRQILVDRARYRNAQKRTAAKQNVTLEDAVAAAKEKSEDLVALDEALTRLSRFNPRLGQVVECHFFGGLSFKETGDVLGTSERTAERDWQRAKAYLRRLMLDEEPGGG